MAGAGVLVPAIAPLSVGCGSERWTRVAFTAEPGWWNGRHGGLKHRCPKGRVGSTPTPGTPRTVGGRCEGLLVPHIRPASTVASALRSSDAGVRDADNAALHGVAIKTIRRWRRLYQRRGIARGQQHLAPPCPRCDGADL